MHQLDVCSEESVAAFASSLEESAVDVLINNAAINPPAEIQASVLGEIDYAEWAATMETNVYGVFRVTKALLPAMLDVRRNIPAHAAKCFVFSTVQQP